MCLYQNSLNETHEYCKQSKRKLIVSLSTARTILWTVMQYYSVVKFYISMMTLYGFVYTVQSYSFYQVQIACS